MIKMLRPVAALGALTLAVLLSVAPVAAQQSIPTRPPHRLPRGDRRRLSQAARKDRATSAAVPYRAGSKE